MGSVDTTLWPIQQVVQSTWHIFNFFEFFLPGGQLMFLPLVVLNLLGLSLQRRHGVSTLRCGGFCKRAQLTWCIFNFLNFLIWVPPSMFLLKSNTLPLVANLVCRARVAM